MPANLTSPHQVDIQDNLERLKCSPNDHPTLPSDFLLPDELWWAVVSSPCTFPSSIFDRVMLNLIKNPNITSSHLFRADIFYDSENDRLLQQDDQGAITGSGMLKHLRAELRPINATWPGAILERTIVRQLIPRNPQLDRPLVQTCHFFTRRRPEARDDHDDNGSEDDEGDEEYKVVLYIPHLSTRDDMPFYHPAVSQLAFLYSRSSDASLTSHPHDVPQDRASITILYRPFPASTPPSTPSAKGPKLSRTALRLLQTIHKHGQGQFAGYEKRVHHDQIVPQKRYQDTYTRLKATYGKQLAEQWVEVTDPAKHVFEDLGIAAFLIEVWRDMYSFPDADDGTDDASASKPPFPGFVDIGCGNGILVYVLLSEGFQGWGFDARRRKTWDIFPSSVQDRLEQRILVPEILFPDHEAKEKMEISETWHAGVFSPPGTFIISNHADELTTWAPLLAHLNRSAFIAIPCCSHDLTGARFRAPLVSRANGERRRIAVTRLPQQSQTAGSSAAEINMVQQEAGYRRPDAAAVEHGSLARNDRTVWPSGEKATTNTTPSAYATLCAYVASLAEEVGFEPEREILRIPSTRNTCILGRRRAETHSGNTRAEGDEKEEEKEEEVAVVDDARESVEIRDRLRDLVERELKISMAEVAARWTSSAEKLMKKPGSGH